MTQQAVAYKSYEDDQKTSSIPKSIDAGRLVVIDGYDKNNHSLTVRGYHDGKPLRAPLSSSEKIAPTKASEETNAITFKTLAGPSTPIVQIDDSGASIRGSSTTGFYSSRDFGNIMKGPISFSSLPHEMRVSGLMTFHPLLTSGFPSTIVTPLPTFQWSLPSASMLGPVARDIALMSTLIGIA